jgi:4-amino-4-deoxy-L-arabinose transferase-like glycosyltransferase
MEQDRLGTQVLNGCIGFCLGYAVGAWLSSRRTGLVAGLVWGAFSWVTAGQTHDRLTDADDAEGTVSN